MNFRYLRQLAEQYTFVLASRSPRRVDLLGETGIRFEQIIPEINETSLPDESPTEFAERLALDKARNVADTGASRSVTMGCDTIVVIDDRILGKPASQGEAFEFLSLLSGRDHVVCTALALVTNCGKVAVGHEQTHVSFNQVAPDRIHSYIATGEPMDKAGAYGIQGMGSFLVDRIEGNLDTIIGLPRLLLEELAKKMLH
jgi:septum formation protein